MNAPCECVRPSLARRVGRIAEWSAPVFPAAALALMPKCPACIAAYAALWTGLGVSLTVAAHVRTGLIIVTAALVVLLVIRSVRRNPHNNHGGNAP